MDELKVGDLVELKSGSPVMTVVGFATAQDNRTDLHVAWFANGDVNTECLDPLALNRVDVPPRAAIAQPMAGGMFMLRVTPDELSLLEAALDSHLYWQLTPEELRKDGHATDPGNDPDYPAAEQLRARLADSLQACSRLR
jgi:uncharacterized protein YodC (DUF2158 family)